MPDSVIVSYPLDTTGILASNRVSDELHAVTENNYRDYYFIVPKFAPFYATSLIITHTYNGITKTLVENTDYYCALLFIGATRAIGKPVYGAITLNNLNTSGVLSVTYNTLGGDWVVDQQAIIERIAERAYNPRTISWEQVVATPTVFPPVPHQWDLVDMVGQAEVVEKLGDIEAAILTAAQSAASTHIYNYSNPHYVTKAQIGLSNIENWKLATQTEVNEGVSDNTLITPMKLRTVTSLYYLKSEVDILLQTLKPPVASRAKTFFMSQI